MKINFKSAYRRYYFLAAILAIAVVVGFGISIYRKVNFSTLTEKEQFSNRLIHQWYQLFLEADRFTDGYKGPVSARTFAYISLAGYETAIPAYKEVYNSLQNKLQQHWPEWMNSQVLDVPSALNACYHALFQKFYISAPDRVTKKEFQIYNDLETILRKSVPSDLYLDSHDFGLAVANAIYEYSSTDTIGHQAYFHNYDPHYVPDSGIGKWTVSEDHPMPALLPHWGKARCFVIKNGDVIAKPLPEYSYNAKSQFYTEALEVMTVGSPLSAENRWIAEFWSDDHDGLTFSPSSRWISIAQQALQNEKSPPDKVLETFLKVSLALNDGGVACWNSKYIYNIERPETYIRKVFDSKWEAHIPSPNFPSYPSGHSVFGAAAAEVLTVIFGANYAMDDKSHMDRDEFNGKPRHFKSFYEMAFENAFSRISLGVHFRMDCEEGLVMGFQIGKRVAELELRRQNLSNN